MSRNLTLAFGAFLLLIVVAAFWIPDGGVPRTGEPGVQRKASYQGASVDAEQLEAPLSAKGGGDRSEVLDSTPMPEIDSGLESTSEGDLDPMTQHSYERLLNAREEFAKKPGLVTSLVLMQKAAVAWSDYTGTSIVYGPGDDIPESVLTAEQWTIWVSGPFGSRRVLYTRAEFPELWEIREHRSSGRRELFDLSLKQDLLQRVEQRADTVVQLLGGE